jgi:hypothetical protein
MNTQHVIIKRLVMIMIVSMLMQEIYFTNSQL